MIEVSFERSLLRGVDLRTQEMGWTKTDLELVTGIRAGGAWTSMRNPVWQRMYETPDELAPQTQQMPEKMAQKLFDFCGMTYVKGNQDFDCHAFVGFLMGWQDTVAAGSAQLELKGEPITDFATTQPNVSYVGRAPQAVAKNAHSFVGTEQGGQMFGVAGPGLALVIGKALDLQRIFGVTHLLETQQKQ